MQTRFDFRYRRFLLHWLSIAFFSVLYIFLVGPLLVDYLNITYIDWLRHDDGEPRAILAILYLVPCLFLHLRISNPKGYGVFHKDHAEIRLGWTTHEIRYDDILNVENKAFGRDRHNVGIWYYWRIGYADNKVIRVFEPTLLVSIRWKKNLYPLRNFMNALSENRRERPQFAGKMEQMMQERARRLEGKSR